jgi:hypothetical protein
MQVILYLETVYLMLKQIFLLWFLFKTKIANIYNVIEILVNVSYLKNCQSTLQA